MYAETLSSGIIPANLKTSLETSSRTLWIGALSFEERCSASLAALLESQLQISEGLAFEYPTNVFPSAEDERLRKQNRAVFARYHGSVCKNGIEHRTIDPYSFHDLQDSIDSKTVGGKVDFILFDITCMTKIHALALAATIAQWSNPINWAVAYSTPENYGNVDDPLRAPGWRDIIVAPLAETAALYNEARGRGIIIAGYEADRLVVAVAELEPSGGLIVIPETSKRPDLKYTSEQRNKKIIRQLTKMRSAHWTREIVGVSDLSRLGTLVMDEISNAKKYDAPAILFPFGPKLLVFVTALQLASEYPDASWFVYPIPSGYNVNYTEGIETTIWFAPKSAC